MAFNPAFGKNAFTPAAPPAPTAEQQAAMSPQALQELYNRTSATTVDTERMSYDGVIVKTALTLALVVAGAVVGFLIPAVGFVGAIVGFVLALVNIFKRQPSPILVLAYAAFQGLAVGAISWYVQVGLQLDGVIWQALLGTGLVFGVTLALFATGKVRESKRATKVFIVAGIAYALFSVINLIVMLTGVNTDPWGLRSVDINILGFSIPLGLLLAPIIILLAAYSLVLDFTDIKRGVDGGAPKIMEWRGVFGLVLTIIWLYIEILRILGIARN
jgi:uncharacterized YccA/Bax inhibitor family protein